MKKIYCLFLCFCFLPAFIFGQYLLYSTTALGGTYNDGVIFYYNPLTGKDSTVFNFNASNGIAPEGDLLYASDGLLYGITYLGGSYNQGTVFRYNPVSGTFTVLVDLDGPNGSFGQGCNSFIEGRNHILYGTTWLGGSHSAGVIFSYNLDTGQDSVLFNFDTLTSGACTSQALVQDTLTNLLYGTTVVGGAYGLGTLYSFNPTGNIFNVLINFDSGFGPMHPESGLICVGDSLLFGMSFQGGNDAVGTIFTYNLNRGTLGTSFSFDTADGQYPDENDLLQVSNGMMYGMTTYGVDSLQLGNLFSFNPDSNTLHNLVIFNFSTGIYPSGSLIQDPDNALLYGTLLYGGIDNYGTVFSYDINTSTFTKLFDFTGLNGNGPCESFTLVKDTGIITGEKVNLQKNSSVSVYPNPFNNFTTILLSSQFSLPNTHYLELADITGRKLKYIEFTGNEYELSADGLAKGLYFIRVYDDENNVVGIRKVVVQ